MTTASENEIDYFPWMKDIKDTELAFGSSNADMPDQSPSIDYYQNDPKGYAKAAQSIFSSRLLGAFFIVSDEEQGKKVLPNEQSERLYRWLMATLSSWALKHEHKIGGVGMRLDESLIGMALVLEGQNAWILAGDITEEEVGGKEGLEKLIEQLPD